MKPPLLTTIILACLFTLGCSSSDAPPVYETNPNLVRGDTEAAQARNTVGLELLEQGKLDEAETKFKEALTADVMYGPAHNNLGKVYYLQKRYYLAAWEFEYAVKLMPHLPEPKNNLGLVFESVDRLDKAVAYYREAYDMEPENPEIIGNLARAQLQRGDRDDGVKQLLSELVRTDTRPQWVEWAREKLALLGGPDAPGPPGSSDTP